MTDNRPYKYCLIFALILIVGLGLALALPWLANSQGLAAQSEVGEQDNTPEATRYYVAKTGDGSDGLSWSTAFTKLQDALVAVAEAAGGEIWVATGVYTPGTDREDSFNLFPGVAVYGGFAGTETSLTDRDWVANPTILSGDIDNNDTNTDGVVLTTTHIVGNNAYHVVRADATTGPPITGSTVLDGFTITAGQADGSYSNGEGGGFYCDGFKSVCSPNLKNVIFSGNFARDDGGAMYNYGYLGTSSPSLTNVTFSGNFAKDRGGAMFNDGLFGTSSPILRDVTFSGNSAGDYGGAMFNDGSKIGECTPSLINVTFSGNSADFGGAMFNNGRDSGNSSPSLTNVAFSGNSADSMGGAMYNDGNDGTSSPTLTNVTFSGNLAGLLGGGMFNSGVSTGASSPKVRNSILWNNQDFSGAGTIGANIYNNSASTSLSDSLLQGSGGTGNWTTDTSYVDGGDNIDISPKFVTPIDPAIAPTTSGNLRLKSSSPAIDVGSNSFVTDVPTDLDGEPRIVDGDFDGTPTVDMGAYEFGDVTYIPLIFR